LEFNDRDDKLLLYFDSNYSSGDYSSTTTRGASIGLRCQLDFDDDDEHWLLTTTNFRLQQVNATVQP
ncbi:hypothetical protein U1Q18_003715, partial [Sarracenia purpurea var. burkii]